jgi:uracil-DNA glycosylase
VKHLIVGQAPSRGRDGLEPLSGRSGRRLADLCGLTLEAFLARFDRVNLLAEWPGSAGAKGDAFPIDEARAAAESLAEVVAARDRIVLLGWNVARAFRFAGDVDGWFDWGRLSRDCGEVVVAPHPSGVNLWWNDPANVARARAFWRALAAD